MNKNQNKKIATVLSAAVMTSTALALSASANTHYVVKSGDTLMGIAKTFNTTVTAIASTNHISNVNMIQVNDTLSIPTNVAYATVSPTVTETYNEKYTVVAGDTLNYIAARFNVTTAQLKAWNSLYDINTIEIGADLIVGAKKVVTTTTSTNTVATAPTYHNVVAGDTLNYLAARYGTTVAQLQAWNNIQNINWIDVGQTLRVGEKADVAGAHTVYVNGYTVQAGDTLNKIASTYRVTVWQLAMWNSISDVNTIHVGQTLRVVG